MAGAEGKPDVGSPSLRMQANGKRAGNVRHQSLHLGGDFNLLELIAADATACAFGKLSNVVKLDIGNEDRTALTVLQIQLRFDRQHQAIQRI